MQKLRLCKPVHVPIKKRIQAHLDMSRKAGFSITRDQAKKVIREEARAEMWVNDIYTVLFRSGKDADQFVGFEEWHGQCAYISIRRNDREPVDSWRDFQEIKNQLAGPNREAVQLYPNEERLKDTANQYHLWVLPEGFTFPMGFFDQRVVTGESFDYEGITTKQSNR